MHRAGVDRAFGDGLGGARLAQILLRVGGELRPAAAGAEVIGVALVGVAMRRRVRVDRHPADRIERTFPGFGALVMVIVAMPGVIMAALRRAISLRVSLFGHGAQSLDTGRGYIKPELRQSSAGSRFPR